MKMKRIGAWFIDIIIVSIIASLFFSLPLFKKDYQKYLDASNKTQEFLINETTSGSSDFNDKELTDLQYDLNVASVTLNTIKIGVVILYFGVMAYFMDGQTLGKKMLKIKIVSNNENKLNPGLFVLREILFMNVIFDVVTIVLFIMCSKSTAITYTTYISYISLAFKFLCYGFIIFRDDERGLHDIIGDTKVIDLKNKE